MPLQAMWVPRAKGKFSNTDPVFIENTSFVTDFFFFCINVYLKFCIKILLILITEFLQVFPSSCPQNKGERGGLPASTLLAPRPEWRRREDGGQREQEGEEGHRGLAASRGSGLEPLTASSCFHTHQTSCPGRGVGLDFPPLFSSDACSN